MPYGAHRPTYVFEVNALLTINGIRKSCKVKLNLIGSSQFVGSGKSCFHDDDKIQMKNTQGFHFTCD